MSEEETEQLNVRIPSSVKRKLKAGAAEQGVSLKDYFSMKVLKEYINKSFDFFETAFFKKKYGFVPKTAELIRYIQKEREEIAEKGEDKLFNFNKFDEALADLERQVGFPKQKGSPNKKR